MNFRISFPSSAKSAKSAVNPLPMLHEEITKDITGLQVALLLNFKESRLDWKRVANERRNRTADGADNADKK